MKTNMKALQAEFIQFKNDSAIKLKLAEDKIQRLENILQDKLPTESEGNVLHASDAYYEIVDIIGSPAIDRTQIAVELLMGIIKPINEINFLDTYDKIEQFLEEIKEHIK